ncbi:MAG TPA: MFS transporter [Lentimicrobium sp.]|nr:MFS transporter [Lentimicrobium sp.]
METLKNQTFRSLRHRNFRLFFFGQIISLPGNWIQSIALGWLVFRMTDSVFLLGVVGFAAQIPSFFITPLAGVFADKVDRKLVLLLTQTTAMLVSLVLAILIMTGNITVFSIVAGSIISGVANAIDNPFRHAFLVNIIDDRKDLPNAIALNSTMYNSARFIGPPIGGFLVAYAGEGVCFLVNGLSYLAVIASLLSLKILPFQKSAERNSIFSDLVSGLKYAYKTSYIKVLVTMVIIISFIGLPFQVFMPVFAKDILHGTSQTLGFLTGALGAGALTGALLLANQSSVRRFPTIILVSSFMFSLGLGAFTLSGNIYFSMASLVITGFGMVVLFASCNTLLQTMVHENMRGRIVALYSMSFMGFTPIGSFLTGSITEIFGLQATLSGAVLLCLITAFWFSRHLGSIKEEIL